MSGDDRALVHSPPSPATEKDNHPITNLGPLTGRSHSNSLDSGVDMDRDGRGLQDELFSALMPTHKEKRGFFAKDQLSGILTEDRVRDELARHFAGSLPEATIAKHANTICQGIILTQNGNADCSEKYKMRTFTKVLAVLIMIGKTGTIIELLEEDISDSDLPLVKAPRPNDSRLFDLRLNREPKMVVRSFENWNQLNVRNFEEWQWTTLPVEFARPTEDGEVKHYKLQDQRILPFIKNSRDDKPQSSSQKELEGGFASVVQVAIHPQHHNFHSASEGPAPSFYAVKRLYSKNKKAFAKEVEILKKFSGNKHEHLISLLATYEQSDRFFLVFHWAKADLHCYWKNVNPVPQFDLNTVTWMRTQCKGIAHGIGRIHAHQSVYSKQDTDGARNKSHVFGHHGDIKPENVLWFADSSQPDCNTRGTLKLSDFGLAGFSIHQTTSMPPKSTRGVTLAYRAPEVDLQEGTATGRSYDIWTLGCLYLEFITWILGGSKLLDEFVEARKDRDTMWHDIETHTFFKLEINSKTKKPTAVIKSAVKQFIKRLHSHQKCSQFIHDFLDMVEGNMLVVKTNNPQDMDRFDIKQVHQELAAMLQRCRNNNSYLLSPIPR